MALSQGQIESVLRSAGVDLGRAVDYLGRGDLEGELGQQKLFRELTGRSPGMGQLGIPDPAKAAREAAERTRQLLAQQKQEEAGLLGQFETAIAGQEKLPAMYKRISTELGIPEQQKVVSGLRNEILRIEGLLEQLPEDIKAQVRGTFTTESQRRLLESARTKPLAKSLSTAGREQARATGTLSDLLGGLGTRMQLETAQMEKELLPIKQRLAAFGDRAAREITGYTQANQMELDALMEKLQMQQQLTMAEQGRAHQLAMLEREYELQKDQLRTDVVTAGGRVKLINSKTGSVIADLGASRTSTGTAGERTTSALKRQLAGEVKNYTTLPDVINLYADKLSLADIKNIYNKNSPYGPAKESGADLREIYRRAKQTYSPLGGESEYEGILRELMEGG